jgi:hypothetical protein
MGEKGEGEEEQVELLQRRINNFFSRENPCGTFCTFCLLSRWGRRVREREEQVEQLQGRVNHFF